MRHKHAMPFGAELQEGGTAFRLWAPGARQVRLAVRAGAGDEQWVQPEDSAGGWRHCFVPGAAAGCAYQWEVDGLRVPDPASRWNPEGIDAPSRVVDPEAFEWDEGWAGRPWHEVVLYELHLGTFTPAGTFAAAAQQLPALQALGVTAIELMPLADFPGSFGWGYDGVLPFAPNASYGSPDELKAFIRQAHRLGLMVFVDVVYNHFGPQGNYLHAYAPDFFSKTHKSPWGAAINFDGAGSRPVRDFFIHNALYWVQEFQVDGLRLDAVHAIVDGGSPHILEEISRAVREATPGRHVHLVLENENNEYRYLAERPLPGRYDGQWNDDFHHILHVALTGETQRYYHDYGQDTMDLLARAFTHGMLFEPSERLEGGARKQVKAAPAQHLPALVNFAHNHDQVGNRAFGERLRRLVPPEAAMLPTLLALLTPAVPMLFFGEEWGAGEPFLYFADWDGELREAVRQGRKREFGHAGDALPDPCSRASFDASRPAGRDSAQAAEALDLVRRALAMRREWIVPRQDRLATGRHTARRIGERALEVTWRYAAGPDLVLELNAGADEVRAPATPGRELFAHRRQGPAESWPAWSARWRLQEAAA